MNAKRPEKNSFDMLIFLYKEYFAIIDANGNKRTENKTKNKIEVKLFVILSITVL